MLKANTKIFDGQPLRLELFGAGTDGRIGGVLVLNNTPYFLYVGTEPRPTREDALFLVEPYSDVSMPVSAGQPLYVIEGPAVGTVPGNCRAALMWTAERVPLAVRRYGRNAVIPMFDGMVNGTASTTLTSQGLGGDGPVARPFAVPASARRRTIYGTTSVALSGATLEGSIDGTTWIRLVDLQPAPNGFVYVMSDELALPPHLRLSLRSTVPVNTAVNMVVDL